MIRQIALGLVAALALGTAAFGQSSDTPFQVKYFGYLNAGDAFIDMSNSGASSTVANPQNGAACVNLYAISPNTNLLTACCSCLVQPNGLASLNVKNDLLGGSGNIPASNSIIVKAMASLGTAGVCNAGTVGTGSNFLMTGMLLWGTTIQPLPNPVVTSTTINTGRTGPALVTTTITSYNAAETSFTPSTLSAAELTALNAQCTALSPGTCNSCRVGAQ